MPPPSAAYTEQLAAFCAGLRYEDLPQDVVERVRLSVLDSIGVMLAGAATALGDGVRRAATRFAPTGQATLLGAADRSTPTAAALVNGTLLEIFELQDGWRLGNVHPCVVIPAAMAVAEWRRCSGRDFIAAVVAGYEVTNRLAWTVVPRHLAGGFLPTGTAGTCGSAAAAGRLLAQDARRMADTLGVAAFILPVSTAENLWCGYSAKPLHAGYAARQGIEAALLAAEGFAGCPIEGPPGGGPGFLEAMTGDVQFERLTERLGDYYTVQDVYFKAIPACRHVHGTAEAVLDIVRREPVDPAQVESVAVHTYDLSASRLNRWTDASSSMITTQFSIPYVAAAALVDRALGMAQFGEDRIHDAAILALARRVSVHADPQLQAVYPQTTPTRVEIRLRDGRMLSHQVDMPKGDPRVPLSRQELTEKFRALAGMVLDAGQVAQVEQAVDGLEQLETLEPLLAPLRRPRTGATRT